MVSNVVCQMDELSNLGSDAPNADDLSNVIRFVLDDPNNEVRIYSDSTHTLTEHVDNMLSR